MSSSARLALLGMFTALFAQTASAQPCSGSWSEQFLIQDQSPYNLAKCNVPSSFRGVVAYDPDGSAPASLIVTGDFSCVAGSTARAASRWNGHAWQAVGTLGPTATAIGAVAFDEDGPGPFPGAIYTIGTGGTVIRWNEISWSNVGDSFYYYGGAGIGTLHTEPTHITTLPFGQSTALLAAQSFESFGPAGASISGRLYQRINGTWQQLAGLTQPGGLGRVTGLGSIASPDGAALLIAHQHANMPWVPPQSSSISITRVTQSGQAQSLAYRPFPNSPTPLETFDAVTGFDPDGAGPSPALVYVAGTFAASPAELVKSQVATLSDGNFTTISDPCDGSIQQLLILDEDGPGPRPSALFAIGQFSIIGGISCNSIARWDGSTWSSLSNGLTLNGLPLHSQAAAQLSLAVLDDDGPGPHPTSLFAAGAFDKAGFATAYQVARWDGQYWLPLGNFVSNEVHALAKFNPLEYLFVAGQFVRVDGTSVSGLARWDGHAWSIPGGANNHIDALAVQSAPTEPYPYLIAGGKFTWVDNVAASHIAVCYNSYNWSPLGPGVDGNVRALHPGPPSDPSSLYVGGEFTASGTLAVNHIARWNFDTHVWTPLDSGVNDVVNALAYFNNNLYAGGLFTSAGGQPASHIARWNGAAWSLVEGGVDGPVTCLAIHDDGRGPALYVGGAFTAVGNKSASNIARWDGATWSPLGPGIGGTRVSSLASIDEDGLGPRPAVLYVGGEFISAGNSSARRLARWDGFNWSEVNGGADGEVLAITSMRGLLSPPTFGRASVFIGGDFLHVGPQNIPTGYLAQWDPCSLNTCYPNCDNSTSLPLLTINDFQCFINRFASGDPYANCDGSSSPPLLNINDFGCFLNQFAIGCP